MKKLLGIVVLGLLLSVNAYADDDIKIGMNYYEVKKILKAKGRKIFLNFPLKKTTKNKNYAHASGEVYFDKGRTLAAQKVSYAFEYDGEIKTMVYIKKYEKNYKLVKIFNSPLEPFDYYLNFPQIDIKDKSKLIKRRTKISNIINEMAKEEEIASQKEKEEEEKIKFEAEKEERELKEMIDKAKTTCQTLGFEQDTDKFSDCTLKLYTQEVDNKVALEVAKQKSSSSSSNSGTMIIYDPVRDRQNKIDKGMEMITGRCTLGYNC